MKPESASQFELLSALNHAPVAVIATGGQGEITYFNAEASRMVGCSSEDVLGKRTGEVFANWTLVSSPDPVVSGQAGGKAFDRLAQRAGVSGSVTDEVRFSRKDGSRQVMTLTVSGMRGRGEADDGFLGVARDRSEHAALGVEVEKLFKELKDVKTAIDEHSIVAITNARGAITYVNEKFCHISKFRAEELIGKDHRIINSGHHPKEFMKGLWETIMSGRVWKGEIRNRAKDGSLYWVATTIVPFLGEDGKPVQFVAIRTDITERKQNQDRLRSLVVELERSNEELKDFAYVVSHDLKAPLRAIGSVANWLSEDYVDKIDAEGQKMLGLLVGRVKRLDHLIDGILAYSRVGRSLGPDEMVDCEPMVRNVIEMLAPPDHIEVAISSPLPSVLIEPIKIQQVFQNLISNGIKFMDKPQAGWVKVSCREEGGFWRFSVADNGPGIPEKYHERIFNLFETIHPRDKKESTGVGLALVKKIVEGKGGRVTVVSPGEGIEFGFTLPKKGEN
jgi:PAS domain S-box-containing protein